MKKEFFTTVLKRVINFICFPLFVCVFPFVDMYNWGSYKYSWGYKNALRFELNAWFHNVTGRYDINII